MELIWRSNGWDGKAPVTCHEARLCREALQALDVPVTQVAEFDDPWQMLEHQHELFGYVVGRPSMSTPATDWPPNRRYRQSDVSTNIAKERQALIVSC